MRTTLVLDEQLFRRAKREASAAGTTLSEMVNTALRHYLLGQRQPKLERTKFSMPVFGQSQTAPHYTPEEIASLRDDGR